MSKKLGFLLILLTSIACAKSPTTVPTPATPSPPALLPPTPTTSLDITEADKAEIIKIATGWALYGLPDDDALIYQENSVLLDTDNLKPDWIPTFDSVQILPQTRSQIQQRAENEAQNIMYLWFSELEFEDDGKALITVNNPWAASKDVDFPLSGGAAQLQFERVNGEWMHTVLWIMIS